jgi:hypothetical protein
LATLILGAKCQGKIINWKNICCILPKKMWIAKYLVAKNSSGCSICTKWLEFIWSIEIINIVKKKVHQYCCCFS